MADLVEIKYPHLDRILLLKPNPEIVLGKEIYWTIKEDGSNLGVTLGLEGDLLLRTRNMPNASEEFYRHFLSTDEADGVRELLEDAENWGSEYVIFGELCVKGRSPTRMETHEQTRFVVFDVWSQKAGRFMNYTQVHQMCYHVGLPCVELVGTCNVSTREALFEFKDWMLVAAKDRGKEGVVGKVWAENPWNTGEAAGTKRGIVYFKEKHDTPKLEKIPRADVPGTVTLPPLPESEVAGAIEKVYADIGIDFFDVRRAMPLVARYVSEECKKHNCASPKDLYPRYLARVQALQEASQ